MFVNHLYIFFGEMLFKSVLARSLQRNRGVCVCVCVQKERGRDFKELAHTTVEADKSDIFKVGQQETQGRLGAVLESDSSLLAESLLLKGRLIFL